VICCGAALVMLIGCEKTTPTGAPITLTPPTGQAGTQMSPEQEQLLNKLEEKLDELEKQGMSFEDALDRMKEQERAAAGPPDLVKDLWPAQRVLGDAIEAARSQKSAETTAALDRLVGLAAAITGDLPASEIAVHCERALAYLSQNALDEAGVEMGMAYRVADTTKFSTLLPEGVIPLIQNNARGQISAGRPREATDVVLTILQKCREHNSLGRLRKIDDAIAGAYAGVERGAWAVVEAELYEADRELNDLAESIRPERWDLTTGEYNEEGTTGTTEPGAEGAAATEQPATAEPGAAAQPGTATQPGATAQPGAGAAAAGTPSGQGAPTTAAAPTTPQAPAAGSQPAPARRRGPRGAR